MERWKQHELTLCLDEKRLGRKHIYLIVILLLLFGQVAAQEKTDSVANLIIQLKSPNTIARSRAAVLLGSMRAKQAVPTLIELLKDENADVRSRAADALGNMGPEAKQAIPALIELLKDESADVRISAAWELGWMAPEAKQAIPSLIELLKDESADVRGAVASALAHIGPEAKQAIPALIQLLKDENAKVRSRAAEALGSIGLEAKQTVHALIELLKDQDEYVRSMAAYALGRIGPEAEQAIPALIGLLKDENADVRSRAANALGRIGLEAKQTVHALIELLKDESADVRSQAASALGEIGSEAKQAIPALIEAIKDERQHVRGPAAHALSLIARTLFDIRSTESLQQLKTAYSVMQDYPELKDNAADIKRTIDYFESLWWIELRSFVERLLRDYPHISLPLGAYLVLQLVWLLFFWRRPLLLLKVITSLGQVGERIKIPKLDIPIPLRFLLVFPLFYYRSRLLDAWVQSNLLIARENFAGKQPVAQRKVYVGMPGSINEETCDSLSAASFQPILNKAKLTILVAGEGGAGKTSLACQMALWAMEDDPQKRLCKTHRMLPVLIESNLETRADGKDAIVETVHGQLGDLIGLTEPIPRELFIQLLRTRRVLVIVDSLSELDETSRKSVRPAQADFSIGALVVTSRIDEELGGATKTTVRPLRLKSNSLSTFLHEYLARCEKRGLFQDDEFFDDCRRLSQIVGEREITVLIARLYADQMIASKEQVSEGARQNCWWVFRHKR